VEPRRGELGLAEEKSAATQLRSRTAEGVKEVCCFEEYLAPLDVQQCDPRLRAHGAKSRDAGRRQRALAELAAYCGSTTWCNRRRPVHRARNPSRAAPQRALSSIGDGAHEWDNNRIYSRRRSPPTTPASPGARTPARWRGGKRSHRGTESSWSASTLLPHP